MAGAKTLEQARTEGKGKLFPKGECWSFLFKFLKLPLCWSFSYTAGAVESR